MLRKNFFLPEPLIVRLAALALALGISEAEIVRMALDAYLSKQAGAA